MSLQHVLTTHWVAVWQDTMCLPLSSLLKQDEWLACDASADDRSLPLYGHKLEIFSLMPCFHVFLYSWEIGELDQMPLWHSSLAITPLASKLHLLRRLATFRPRLQVRCPDVGSPVVWCRFCSTGLSLFPLLTFPCILFLLTGLFGAPTRRGFLYSIWYSICVPRIMVIFPCIFVYSPNCCVCSVNQDSFFIILFIPDCHGERGWKEHSKENISAISGIATHGHGLQVSTHTI